MPYKVEKRSGGKPFKIINKNTGKVVGSSESRAKAESSIKHRLKGEKGK